MLTAGRQFLGVLLSASLVTSTSLLDGCNKSSDTQPQATAAQAAGAQAATTYAVPSPDQLDQMVAPIALYPDNLVGIVLAASTYPDQVTAANAWVKQNSSLKGAALQQAVDQQPWDGSVKALTDFPQVLAQMAGNLSWTSAMGDAYYNAQQDVMNAVQRMRQRAQASGSLKSNQQQTVTVQNTPPEQQSAGAPQQTIIVQPAQPEIVYVPQYNPTVVYGAPVQTYPGYSTADVVATSLLTFGLGIAVGAAISNNNNCCGWGYNSWGTNWHSGSVVYNHNTYVSTSNTFARRNNYYSNGNRVNNGGGSYNRAGINGNNRPNVNPTRADFNRDNRQNLNNGARNNGVRSNDNRANRPNVNAGNRPNVNAGNRPGQGNLNRPNTANNRGGGLNQAQTRDSNRGYGQQPSRGNSGGAFNGYNAGGAARADSARGQQSLNRPPAQSRPASQPTRSANAGNRAAPQKSGGARRR
jgi:hypothetical protein